jgi:3-oxoacyl-[acyl-carrier protein] reductase
MHQKSAPADGAGGLSCLNGLVALVTGGSRGFGRAVALLLARQGARVVINTRKSQASAEETLALLEENGEKHFTVQGDVANAADVRAMFQTIQNECGRLDVLVNNAGVNRDARLASLTESMWDEVVATNLKGPFLCAQAAAPLMLRNQRGAILNIASETALTGRIGACNYIAAKSGLLGLTKALAKELAPLIRVNCMALGYIHTEELAERFHLDDVENVRRIEKDIPLGRIGTPEEAASAALFLCSDQSRYVTGQVVAVGGGKWM